MSFRWLLDGDGRIANAVCFALVVVLTGVVFAEITAKAVFSVSILWSTDFVTYLLVWMIFLGGALCARDNEQVSIQIAVDRLPSTVRFLAQGLQRICTIGVMLALSYSLFRLLDVLHTSWVPTMPVRQSYFALPCVACLLLYAAFEIAALIRLLHTARLK